MENHPQPVPTKYPKNLVLSITPRWFFALILMAGLALVNYLFTGSEIKKINLKSGYLNLLDLQRMLYQRSGSLALLLSKTPENTSREEIRAELAEIVEYLQKNQPSMTGYLQSLSLQNFPFSSHSQGPGLLDRLKVYNKNVEQLATLSDYSQIATSPELTHVRENVKSGELIDLFNQLQEVCRQDLSLVILEAHRYSFILLILNFLSLIGMAFLIFNPLNRHIFSQFKILQQTNALLNQRTTDLDQARLATVEMMNDAKTAQKEAEEARNAVFRLAAIVDSSDDAITGKTFDGVITSWNKGAELMYGYTEQEIVGNKIDVLLPPGLVDEIISDMNDIFFRFQRGEKFKNYETVRRRKDGKLIDVGLTVSPIKDFSGKLIGVSTIGRDITERKHAELVLKESKERFRRLIESTNVIAWEANALSGQFTYVSPQAEKILGYPVEQWYEKDFWPRHMHPEDREWVLDYGSTSAKHAKEYEFEYRMIHANGQPVWLRDIVSVETTSDAQSVLRGFMTDINDRKKAETEIGRYTQELQRSNLDLEQFAYVASHDLKEPLRVVAGYAQLLGKRYKDKLDANADEYITYMLEGLGRMQKLIDGLLIFSRVSKKNTPFQTVDCGVSCDLAIKNLSLVIAENKAQVTRDPLPGVLGDSTQLTQLFQNLISNAIKFRGEQPPVIHLSVAENKKEWTFVVADNGIGIKKEYFARIFELFKRLHNYSEYPGTGIGLALCKKIVEHHGGRMWVESEIGRGSKFYFALPKNKETAHEF